jgi:hypothetical protein
VMPMGRQNLPLHWYQWRLSNLSVPLRDTAGQAGWGEQDAEGHGRMGSNWVRQSLVVCHHAHPEERRSSLLRGLQEAEWHHQEGLLPTIKDDTLVMLTRAKWL